jgi:hypothetical protein
LKNCDGVGVHVTIMASATLEKCTLKNNKIAGLQVTVRNFSLCRGRV